VNDETELDKLFTTARACESALAIALRVGDETTAAASATRLRKTLGHARFAIVNGSVGNPPRRHALVEMFLVSTRGMRQLLQRNPITSAPDDEYHKHRLRRWGAAIFDTKVPRGGPHLFELDSHGRDLQQALFNGLHVARSKFLTDLRDATFVDTFIERSDFTYARLERTLWQRTCITHSFYHDASFENASLDDVAFFDCDLRDTDFSHNSARATMNSTQFIRCDLRGSRWFGRDLSSASSTIEFIDCQLHGMVCHGTPRSVSRADISPSGDGSWVMGVC
jgi:hypothetical protein